MSITKKSEMDKGKNDDHTNKDELDREDLCESVDKSVFDVSHVEIQSEGLASADDPKRELQLSEFSRDRDFIILSIQSALKSRQHKQAQEIVSQYRFAAEIDADFNCLAEHCEQLSSKHKNVDDLLFVLAATPDDEHITRLSLYEQLLATEPSNQVYKDAYQLSRQALGLEVDKASATPSNFRLVFYVILGLAVAFVASIWLVCLNLIYF